VASPVADSYSAASGASVYGGRYPGGALRNESLLASLLAGGGMAMHVADMAGVAQLAGLAAGGGLVGLYTPAWLTGSVGEWRQISGTSAPSELRDYCGLAWREEAGSVEAASMASGGHGGNYYDNQVKTLQINVDAPSWAVRTSISDPTGMSIPAPVSAYFPSDGKPYPRHTYWYHHWVPEINRYMMMTCRFVGSNAYDFTSIRDGFNPDDNTWDAPGTYSGGIFATVRDPATGIFYNTGGSKYTPSTGVIDGWSLTGGAAGAVQRGGHAFDTLRGNMYHLSTGDNWSVGGSTVNSVQITTGGACTAITFNSSAGLTDFIANGPGFLTSQIEYNPDLDVFYFYNGAEGQATKIYRITPNGGTVWDMDLMTVTGLTPAYSLGSGQGGVNTKFKYIQKYKALLLVVASNDVYFLRTGT
jgi:hypothetical protein